MKRISTLALALVVGGFVSVSAQDVPDEPAEPSDNQQTLTTTITTLSSVMPNCGGSFLGVVGDEVDKETVQELGLPGEYGALINEVVKETGAEKAGLQKNDVIVGYNGARVESMAQLRRLIGETPAGRTVDLKVIRNGAEQDISAELGTRSMPQITSRFFSNDANEFEFRSDVEWDAEEFDARMKEKMEELELHLGEMEIDLSDARLIGPNGMDGEVWFKNFEGEDGEARALYFRTPRMNCQGITNGRPKLGVTVQTISSQLARYFKLDEGQSGALISEIHEGTPAERDGLKVGDVILSVDGESVEQVRDLPRIISEKEGRIEVNVVRDGAQQTLWIDLGSQEDIPSTNEGEIQEEIRNRPDTEQPGLSFNGQ